MCVNAQLNESSAHLYSTRETFFDVCRRTKESENAHTALFASTCFVSRCYYVCMHVQIIVVLKVGTRGRGRGARGVRGDGVQRLARVRLLPLSLRDTKQQAANWAHLQFQRGSGEMPKVEWQFHSTNRSSLQYIFYGVLFYTCKYLPHPSKHWFTISLKNSI